MKLLALLIGIGLGGWGMYMYYPKLNPVKGTAALTEKNDAKVSDVGGVFIYINAEPKALYTELGELTQSQALETLQTLGKLATAEDKDMLHKLVDAAKEFKDQLDMDQRLKAFVTAAKKKDPKVEGLVFRHSDLDEATLIKFSN